MKTCPLFQKYSPLCALLLLIAASPLWAQTGEAPASATPSQSPQELSGLLIQCPVKLAEASKSPRNESPTKENPIKQITVYKGKSGDIDISVSLVEFMDGLDLSLQGAADGSANSISALKGVSNPKYQTTDLTISGLPAKRLSYSATRFEKELCVEGLYLIKGQQMWTVNANFPGSSKESRPLAEAILSSAVLK
jgi:hypothetical protein